MQLSFVRPEDRRRSGDDGLWSDTLPLCHRSEAFAEDLPAGATDAGAAEAGRSAENAPWTGRAALPLLGLAVAAVYAILGR